MQELEEQLSVKEKAYTRLLGHHVAQFIALLHEIGGTEHGKPLNSRELSIAYTKLEEAYLFAREHIIKRGQERAKVN